MTARDMLSTIPTHGDPQLEYLAMGHAQSCALAAIGTKHTSVFPEPLAPAIDVISPYRNPPPRAWLSMDEMPVPTGNGLVFSWASAAARRVEASNPGAGRLMSVIPCVITELMDQFLSRKGFF